MFDSYKFLENNRIHVQGGSFIDSNEHLLAHPRELMPVPELQENLRRKITESYSLDEPSFFECPNVMALAKAFATILPASLATQKAALDKQFANYQQSQAMGIDVDIAKQIQSEQHPLGEYVNKRLHPEPQDAATKEACNKTFVLIQLSEMALKRAGSRNSLLDIAGKHIDVDSLLSNLAQELNLGSNGTALLRDSARSNDLSNFGVALGIPAAEVQAVINFSNYATEKQFSENLVKNWRTAIEQPNMLLNDPAIIAQEGLNLRVNKKISELRLRCNGNFQITEHAQTLEKHVAAALSFLPQALQETLFRLGTEIAFTPEHSLKTIDPSSNAYGYHRHVTNNPEQIGGVYQLFLSYKGDAEAFARLVQHEAHHLLFPQLLSQDAINRVELNAKDDSLRLKALKELADQYMIGNQAQQEEALRTLNLPEFAVNGKNLYDSLGINQSTPPETMVARVHNFFNQVSHAHERLQIDSDFYNQNGGYPTPEQRFQEINSRYAELRNVRLVENADMLKFIVPGQTDNYENVYMQHIEAELQNLRARDNVAPVMPSAPSLVYNQPQAQPKIPENQITFQELQGRINQLKQVSEPFAAY